jgi:DNA-binding transcriptional regulator YhcF (GntR family)
MGGVNLLENLGEDKSIYIQISEMIEDEILRDILIEEEQVPSTTELSKFYKINPATAAKGINLLVDKGILYKKRGIGMFVNEGAKERIQQSRKSSFYENYVKKIISEAKLIGIDKAELKKMIDESLDL